MRTFAQSRHCAITGLAEGCDFGRRTSGARTVNHARGSCGRLPTSRPVHDLGCAVPAAPQCRREVSVGPLPRPGTPLGTVRRPPGLHARRLCAAPLPNPAEVHAAPSPGQPVDLVLCVHIRDVLRPWLCAARHRRRHQLHRPLIVTALAPFALGERVGAARAIAVGVGFLGAMVVVRPGSGAYHWAVFLIFISAAASAVTQVLSRKLDGHDAPETSNTYMVLAGFVLASLPLPFVWHTPASGPDA